LGHNSADQFFPRSPRSSVRRSSDEFRHRRASRTRMPSSTGYLVVAFLAAVGLFFALWWILVSGGDETPWIPASLAASVVLLVALSAREIVMRRAWTRYLLSAREIVMRRAWTRYLLDHGDHRHSEESTKHKGAFSTKANSSSTLSATLRTIKKQSAEANSSGSPPEAHLDVFHLCQGYIATTEDALQSNAISSEKKITIRAGQERVRSLQKHHLLTWARDSSRSLTHQAQNRARTSDKIETANRALDCLESVLKIYPDERDLNESKVAILEFITSVKVAHWVELAERSAFKGHYRRAIERYKDALFYLNRGGLKDDVRIAGAERIGREIESLRTRLKASRGEQSQPNAADGMREEDRR